MKKEELAIISLESAAVITDRVKAVGAEIRKQIEELDIENLIANEDSKKSIKAMSVNLNKLFNRFETERKAVKAACLVEYYEFEEVYKPELAEIIKGAQLQFKVKLSSIDQVQLKAKEEALRELYAEYCEMFDIDFVTFEHIGLKINLSTTFKKWEEQMKAYFTGIAEDLESIDSMTNKIEVLAEYYTNRNLSQSIKAVNTRLAQQRKVRDRTIQDEQLEKTSLLLSIPLTLEGNEYVHAITEKRYPAAITALEIDDFKNRIEEIKKENTTVQPVKIAKVVEVVKPKAAEPTGICEFSVECTQDQLTALSAFLDENNYKYKNI